jgi:alkylation response protein AidB-like acyl-CoA dehydrogenase
MLNPTEEQLSFQAEVRRFLRRSWPLSVSRTALEAGQAYDPAAWSQLAGLGALGLLVPDRHGGAGAGAGVTEAAFVSEELGRVLLPVPYLSSAVISARLLSLLAGAAHAGDTLTGDTLTGEAVSGYLGGIASGATVATTAFLDAHGRWSPDAVAVRAEPAAGPAGEPGAEPAAGPGGPEGPGWRLSGTAPFVADAESAGLILVLAAAPDGLGIFAVENAAGSPGPAVQPLECLDTTQPLSRVRFDAVPAARLGPAADATAVMADVVDAATACAAAAALGAAERCLAMSVGYAKTRVQFGRTIGSYQAIKHLCADMFGAVQSARSAVHNLLYVLDHGAGPGTPDAALAVSIAKACCSDVLVACAQNSIQIHGGIGFTWEHEAHYYLRRAMAHAYLLGDAAYHRQRVAHLIGAS